jgi:rhodanese-related sulfurtransferase
MKSRHYDRMCVIGLIVFFGLFAFGLQAAESQPAAAVGVEISTDELARTLSAGNVPVIDVRPPKEFEISHIPGSVNVFETEIDQMMILCKDTSSGVVLYCNGPYCGKTVRVAERLSQKGCTNIKRYQHGLPVWRAFGNIAETHLPGFKYIFSSDKTAVFVDARSKEEYAAGSVPAAVNLSAREIEEANQDGRLPYTDHGTRIIVFGRTINQARELAETIAHRAYWNSSYLSTTYEDLKKAALW